jgi:hypothetical protein
VSHGKRVTYDVISYGEWTRPRMRNFRKQCCDCGLIHRLDFRIVDGKVEFRTRRDDRATAAARRTFRFTPDEGRTRRGVRHRASSIDES